MANTHLVVYCTCPDQQSAEKIAKTVVDERLVACVNIIPGIQSFYRWEGQVQQDAEQLMMIKTTQSRFELLKERIAELHPYELPEIVAVNVAGGLAGYLQWISDSCKDSKP